MSNYLNNRYLIEKQIGAGGMGEVYKGYDAINNNHPVAIKRSKLTSEVNRKRFYREYKFLSKIPHPSLIKAYDYFDLGKETYMVIEFIEGVSMRDIIDKHPNSLTLIQQLAIANKAARGVEVLNRGGIIHRDIKPDNIMVNAANPHDIVVKILDLGIAKSDDESSQLTAKGAVIGTMAYLSPEQADGQVNDRSDIFSLGTTFYQFFCWHKRSPFFTENPLMIIHKIGHHEPATLYEQVSQTQPNLSEPDQKTYKKLSEVIAKAMDKDASKRWSSAGELADELAKIQYEIIQSQTTVSQTQVDVSLKIDNDLETILDEVKSECADQDVEQSDQKSTKAKKKKPAKEKHKPQAKTAKSVSATSSATLPIWVHILAYALLIGLCFSIQSTLEKTRKPYQEKLDNLHNSYEKKLQELHDSYEKKLQELKKKE